MKTLKIKKIIYYLSGLIIFAFFQRGYSSVINSRFGVDNMGILNNTLYYIPFIGLAVLYAEIYHSYGKNMK